MTPSDPTSTAPSPTSAAPSSPTSTNSQTPEANASRPGGSAEEFALVADVEVEVTLEIGRKRLKIADILELAPGQTVELDKAAGEMLDILVNGQLLGRGEAIVVGNRYAVRIAEIAKGPRGGR